MVKALKFHKQPAVEVTRAAYACWAGAAARRTSLAHAVWSHTGRCWEGWSGCSPGCCWSGVPLIVGGSCITVQVWTTLVDELLPQVSGGHVMVKGVWVHKPNRCWSPRCLTLRLALPQVGTGAHAVGYAGRAGHPVGFGLQPGLLLVERSVLDRWRGRVHPSRYRPRWSKNCCRKYPSR